MRAKNARAAKPLIVMKFGGTSVASPERIHFAANKVIRAKRKGSNVVVIVSAPGEMTDELLELARRVAPEPDLRELDMLLTTGEQMSIALFAMALQSSGVQAVSLTGPQAGIMATKAPTAARIISIHPERIKEGLRRGKVFVVAGFQGITLDGDVATLGRGGSDLTAVALAAALGAEACEIYTDVEGVFTADPRLVPQAKKIRKISYDEMLEMAASGAQIMQTRALEVAKRFHVPLEVKYSFSHEPGTCILELPSRGGGQSSRITGMAVDRNLRKITLAGVPDKPGMAAKILKKIADFRIPVDMIVQSAARPGRTSDISMTVPAAHWSHAKQAFQQAARMARAKVLTTEKACAKVSVVARGLRKETAAAVKIFETLAKHRINIEMIATSDIKIACVVDDREAVESLRALHEALVE